jgi:hypothetical protein
VPGIKNFEYSDILGWSSTRYDTFSTCRRQYFYNYYAKFDKDVGPEKIKQLKALTSIPLEIGNLTHECIATLLKRLKARPEEPIDRTRFSDHMSSLALKALGRARFSEVYYRQVGSIDLHDLTSESGTALNNLLGAVRQGL